MTHLCEQAFEDYPTPTWVTEGLLATHPPRQTRIAELTAGVGSIANVAERWLEPEYLWVNEYVEERYQELLRQPWECESRATCRDAFDIEPPADPEQWAIIENPPYVPSWVCTKHMGRMLSWGSPYVAIHVPVFFLSGASGRDELFRQYGEPQGLYYFEKRPKYRGGGGKFDPVWLVWDKAWERVGRSCNRMIEIDEAERMQRRRKCVRCGRTGNAGTILWDLDSHEHRCIDTHPCDQRAQTKRRLAAKKDTRQQALPNTNQHEDTGMKQ